MADPDLVEMLKQGYKVWNQWKEARPSDEINLQGIDFHAFNLRGINFASLDLQNADLSRVDLTWSNLSKANLSGANMSETNLTLSSLIEADLTGTQLIKAELTLANLRSAILVNANFYNAKLDRANLINANFRGADLTNVQIGNTAFDNIDLREVKGLDTIYHFFPSSIGLDTIYRSKGQISEVFLRGAGVPEPFITNMRALVNSMSPIEFYSCFISYSHQDEDFAKRLHADLQAKGVRCWFAPEDLKIGDHYHQRIDEAIRLYDKLILVLSNAAVQSAWVEREVVAAREKEDRQQREVLFPLRLDNAVMDTSKAWAADVRRRWHIGDFTRWKEHDCYQRAFERLLRDLREEKQYGREE